MKNTIKITLSVLTLVALSACSFTNKPSTAQKKALDSVSPTSQAKEKGFIQNSLDSWLEQEWSPTVEKDEKIQKKYMKVEKTEKIQATVKTNSSEGVKKVKYVENPDKPFTLQEYVDKAGVYIKAHENDKTESNVKKLDAMPVIGN